MHTLLKPVAQRERERERRRIISADQHRCLQLSPRHAVSIPSNTLLNLNQLSIIYTPVNSMNTFSANLHASTWVVASTPVKCLKF